MTPTPLAEETLTPTQTPTYTVGSLVYDRRAAFVLFGWLLWGDFAFTFFEQIFGRFMPLYLKELNASNTLIGITTGSFAGLVNILFLPGISQWSDRFRSRLGRRIPFLVIVTPLTVLALLGIGFAEEIANFLTSILGTSTSLTVTRTTLILGCICLFTILFHFFNMVLVNAFNWLLRDVVPQPLMPWFISWFRFVGSLATVIFLWYVFPTMISHRRIVFLSIGLFYFAAFMLMCWQVKEGKYPPPEPHPEGSNPLKRFGLYFRDCFSLPIYRYYFISCIMLAFVGSANSFTTLFAKHTLKLDLTSMGHVYTYSTIFSLVAYVPMGWLCSRFSPLRIYSVSLTLVILCNFASYFYIRDQTSWLAMSLIMTLPGVSMGLSSLALVMQLFPDKAFGQFSSAINVLACGTMIFGNYAVGLFMDLIHSHYETVFLWNTFFYIAGLIPLLLVWREWKRHGGPHHYVAPLPKHME